MVEHERGHLQTSANQGGGYDETAVTAASMRFPFVAARPLNIRAAAMALKKWREE
jgi:hypothetical protein